MTRPFRYGLRILGKMRASRICLILQPNNHHKKSSPMKTRPTLHDPGNKRPAACTAGLVALILCGSLVAAYASIGTYCKTYRDEIEMNACPTACAKLVDTYGRCVLLGWHCPTPGKGTVQIWFGKCIQTFGGYTCVYDRAPSSSTYDSDC